MKKKASTIKKIISVVIVLAVLIAGLNVLGYALTPPSFNYHINHELSVIDEQGGRIDMMFVGASRVYHTFIPTVFMEDMGYGQVYNFGAANAPYSATYYQLKNMAERYHPSRVVIGVTLDELIDQEWLRGKMVIWDRLNLKGKLEFLFGGLGLKNWKYAITAYRFRNELENIEYNVSERKYLEETNYAPQFKDEYHYGGFGFISGDTGLEEGHIAIDGARDFSVDRINSAALGWLDKCISYCQNNGIDVVLVTAPTSMMRLYNIKNYQDAVDYYVAYAEEKGVPYYNLNLLKDREEFLPDSLMFDYNHVNAEGANIISHTFAQILNDADNGLDTGSYFYSSFEELKDSVHRMIAVGCMQITCGDSVASDDAEADETDEDAAGAAEDAAGATGDENEAADSVAGEGMITAHLDMISFHRDEVIPEYQIEILYNSDKTAGYTVLVPWTTEEHADITVPAKTEATAAAEDVAGEGDITPDQADQINKENGFTLKIRARTGIDGEPEAVWEVPSSTVWDGYELDTTGAGEAYAAENYLF